MNDVKDKSDNLDDISKVKAWKNMVFNIYGKSFVGVRIYKTEVEARMTIIDHFAKGENNCLTNGKDVIFNEDYSHSIQIPAGNK